MVGSFFMTLFPKRSTPNLLCEISLPKCNPVFSLIFSHWGILSHLSPGGLGFLTLWWLCCKSKHFKEMLL